MCLSNSTICLRHYVEVENTLRVKEDVDFKLSSRKLQAEVDRLTRELESAEEKGKRAAERRRGDSAAAEAAETAAKHAAELEAGGGVGGVQAGTRFFFELLASKGAWFSKLVTKVEFVKKKKKMVSNFKCAFRKINSHRYVEAVASRLEEAGSHSLFTRSQY